MDRLDYVSMMANEQAYCLAIEMPSRAMVTRTLMFASSLAVSSGGVHACS